MSQKGFFQGLKKRFKLVLSFIGRMKWLIELDFNRIQCSEFQNRNIKEPKDSKTRAAQKHWTDSTVRGLVYNNTYLTQHLTLIAEIFCVSCGKANDSRDNYIETFKSSLTNSLKIDVAITWINLLLLNDISLQYHVWQNLVIYHAVRLKFISERNLRAELEEDQS